MIVHIDIETRSAIDLKAHGTYVYAEDESTRIQCACWAIDDGPIQTWINGQDDTVLKQVLATADKLYAHNAQFERVLLDRVGTRRMGWPEIPIEKWNCTMSMALAAALPGSLDALARFFDLAEKKDAEGYALMLRMCKPLNQTFDQACKRAANAFKRCAQVQDLGMFFKPKTTSIGGGYAVQYIPWAKQRTLSATDTAGLVQQRNALAKAQYVPPGCSTALEWNADEYCWQQTFMEPDHRNDDTTVYAWLDDYESMQRLAQYCARDVAVERQLTIMLPPLSKREQQVYTLDQIINERGFMVDADAARVAEGIVQVAVDDLNQEMHELTDGRIAKVTQVSKILGILREVDPDIDSVDKSFIKDALEGDKWSEFVRNVLTLRREGGKSSVSKLTAMVRRANADRRVRGAHRFHGASTGRWSGEGVQTQNMARPTLFRGDEAQGCIEGVFSLLHSGMPANTIADAMNTMYGPPIAAIADSVRGFIQASPGKRIVAVDFASIEARLAAWAADEFDTLELYESGADLYIHEAAKINSVDPTTIDKKDPRRQEGKVAILALGYGGSAGALGKMAKNYGLELNEEKKKWIVDQWRIAHPKIAGKRRAEGPDKGKLLFEGGRPAQPGIWQEMEAAAIAALRTRNTKFPFANGKGFFIAGKTMLHMALPSGRMLRYPKARLVQDDYGRLVIEYYSKNPVNSNVWGFYRIWGGTFFENFIQAVARDLLVWFIMGAEENGYPVIMHVHDELCVEVDTDIAEACYEKLVQLARRRPAWGTNIPMDGEGWIGVRFRKG